MLPALLSVASLGVGWLGGLGRLLMAIFGGLITLTSKFTGWKLAIRITIAVFFIGTLVTAVIAINGLLAGLTKVTPLWYDTFQSWVVPSNFSACLGIIIATRTTIWFWHWKKFWFEITKGL